MEGGRLVSSAGWRLWLVPWEFIARRSSGAGHQFEGVQDRTSERALMLRHLEAANESRQLSLLLPSLGDKQALQP